MPAEAARKFAVSSLFRVVWAELSAPLFLRGPAKNEDFMRTIETLDDDLIALLRADGRATISQLGRHLGVPRGVVRERLHRLLSDQHVTVVAVADPAVLGLNTLCHLAVHVDSSPQEAARVLAGLPEASLVTITSGPHELVVEIRARDQREMFDVIARVRDSPGVARVTTLLYIDVYKSPYSSLTRPQRTSLDDLDRRVIDALQRDGRMSFASLGERLEVSESTVRARVNRLIEDHVIRVTAVAKRNNVTRSVAMGLGINVRGDGREIIDTLRSLTAVEFAATSIGAYDLLVTLSAGSLEDLQTVVDRIRDEPDVRRIESWVHLAIIKESYSPS
jgi:DNA-binding Lrp family transcriptional regulator